MRTIIIDVATSPIPEADGFIEDPKAPANYKDEAKIAAYIVERKAELCAKAALEPDLARITGIGLSLNGSAPVVKLCRDQADELAVLKDVQRTLSVDFGQAPTVIGFNSRSFDWPMLNARARYLGLTLKIDTRKFHSYNIDLLAELSDYGNLTERSLSFYVKRLGWTDLVKPLTGAEEAAVPVTGKWDELAASLEHDVIATSRLAKWLGHLPSYAAAVPSGEAHA